MSVREDLFCNEGRGGNVGEGGFVQVNSNASNMSPYLEAQIH